MGKQVAGSPVSQPYVAGQHGQDVRLEVGSQRQQSHPNQQKNCASEGGHRAILQLFDSELAEDSFADSFEVVAKLEAGGTRGGALPHIVFFKDWGDLVDFQVVGVEEGSDVLSFGELEPALSPRVLGHELSQVVHFVVDCPEWTRHAPQLGVPFRHLFDPYASCGGCPSGFQGLLCLRDWEGLLLHD